MQQNCKCAKCKKTLCRHYSTENQNPSIPSRIPMLQNKCTAFNSTLPSPSSSATPTSKMSEDKSKCCCSEKQSEQKYGYSSTSSNDLKVCCDKPEGKKDLQTIKRFNIDVDKTIKEIQEKRQTRGCTCEKKELESRKITSNISTKLQKSGCICGQKDIQFSSTSMPVSLTFKNPDGQSHKSLCSCMNKDTKSSDTLRHITSSNQIILPEVKIEICPDKIQTIQIDVKPTDLNNATSGIITIPVQLRFRRCHEVEEVVEKILPVRTEKLLFESCTNKVYMENYMEPLIEELEPDILIASEEEEAVEEPEKPKTPEQRKRPLCNCNYSADESSKKTEIIGLKRAPWREVMEKENYIEPYLVEGYCASTDNVEIQTDLVLGEQLLSDSLNSVPESKSKTDVSRSGVCVCGRKNVKASETIPWNLLFLTPPPKKPISFTPADQLIADYVLIKKLFTEPAVPQTGEIMIPWTPPPPKVKKKKKLSSCCAGGTEEIDWPEPPEPEPLPDLVPLPEKITFVYQTNCANNEPYLNALARVYPQVELSSTPPKSLLRFKEDSKTTIPWKRLEIPKKIKIRKIVKLKIEKKPILSASAPCLCSTKKVSMGSVKDAESKKSVTSNMPVPCPYLTKMRSLPNQSTVQTLGNNKYKTKIIMDNTKSKSCPVTKQWKMKTKFLAEGLEGKMSTKVTFKKDKDNAINPCKSSPQNWQFGSTDISPINSKTVTCKYLNQSLLESTENSRPELTSRSNCAPDTCKFKKPPEPCPCPPCQKSPQKFKTDPVVAAFQACEAELKPVREALSTLKQNLKNLNMPELDCIFQSDDEDFNVTQCPCKKRQSQKSGLSVRIRPQSPCPCKCNKSRTGQSGKTNSPTSCAANRNVSGLQDRKTPPSPRGNTCPCKCNKSRLGQSQKIMPPTPQDSPRNKSPATCAANRTASPSDRDCCSNKSRRGQSQRIMVSSPHDSYISGHGSPCPCKRDVSGSGFGESHTMMPFCPFGENISDHASQMSTRNIFKARTQRFYSTSTYNTYYPDSSPSNLTPYNINQTDSRQRGYDENYYSFPQDSPNNICPASCNISSQNSSSSGSSVPQNYSIKTVLNVPAKRNKGIQKTGSMYRTNIKKQKCAQEQHCCIDTHSKASVSESGSGYTVSSITSVSYIKPCGAATQPKISKCSKSGKKRIKSQLSFARLTESMGPFIEAIRSILTVDDSKTCRKGKNVSYDANLMTKQMKKMRVHMRIRPSKTSKRKK